MLLNKCGDVEEPLVIESSGDELNLTLFVRSQEKAVSKRGLFAFFTGNVRPSIDRSSILMPKEHNGWLGRLSISIKALCAVCN